LDCFLGKICKSAVCIHHCEEKDGIGQQMKNNRRFLSRTGVLWRKGAAENGVPKAHYWTTADVGGQEKMPGRSLLRQEKPGAPRRIAVRPYQWDDSMLLRWIRQ
jgi:hypothetical protein